MSENVGFIAPAVDDGRQYNADPERKDEVKHVMKDDSYKHPDVDGGWGYVVLAAIFGSFFINAGLLSTIGIYYVQLLEYFGKDRSHTSWIGSLMNAFFMLAGPLSSYIMHRFNTRTSMMIGSVIMATGLYASSFTPSLELMFFTYGIIVAIGMNFVYTAQISALNMYFNKYQYIATSFAMVGIGIGVFLVNMWTEYNIAKYGWRGSLIWNAGLSLQLCVLGSLVFPLQWPDIPSIESCTSLQPTFNTPLFLSAAGNLQIGGARFSSVVPAVNKSPEAPEDSGSWKYFPQDLVESTWNALKDACFWLISFAFFFAMLSTTSIFIIYKDFVKSIGFAEQYTTMLIGFGLGDITGRLSMGIAHTTKFFNPVWSYCGAMFSTGVVLICHIFINSISSMYILGALFGMTYGAQNVLVAIAPVKLFGKERLVVVFGNLLFWGGIGALFGAPIAGVIVDKTSSGYSGVLGMALGFLILASMFMMMCAIIDGRKSNTTQ